MKGARGLLSVLVVSALIGIAHATWASHCGRFAPNLPPEVDSLQAVEDSIVAVIAETETRVEADRAAADRAVGVMDSVRAEAEQVIADARVRAETIVDSIHSVARGDTSDTKGGRDYWQAIAVENLHGWQNEMTERRAWQGRAETSEDAADSLRVLVWSLTRLNGQNAALAAMRGERAAFLEDAYLALQLEHAATRRSRGRWRTASVVEGALLIGSFLW